MKKTILILILAFASAAAKAGETVKCKEYGGVERCTNGDVTREYGGKTRTTHDDGTVTTCRTYGDREICDTN